MAIDKIIYPESFDYGMSAVEIIDSSSRGLDKQAMVKRASCAFDDILDKVPNNPKLAYLHIITTGGGEKYSCNANGDYWNMYPGKVRPFIKEGAKAQEMQLDGGLSKYHDSEYMKNGEVFKEHKTRRQGATPSGVVIAARINPKMFRGELLIGVDKEKWAPELQKKASGKDIHFSVGSNVPFDICSVCLNKAAKRSDYCEHAKHSLMRLTKNGSRVYLYNDAPHFYDISGVRTPADKIAFALRQLQVTGKELEGTQKEASLSYGMSKAASMIVPPMLSNNQFWKRASLFQKLAVIEKQIPCSTSDELICACGGTPGAEEELIKHTEGFDASEVLDSCNRKGILLSPKALFKLLGREVDSKAMEDIELEPEDLEKLFDSVQECPEVTDDASYDLDEFPNVGLLNLLEKFVPELSLKEEPVTSRTIKVTIIKGTPKVTKKASQKLPDTAREVLRKEYAKYVGSFLEAAKGVPPVFVICKVASIVRVGKIQ